MITPKTQVSGTSSQVVKSEPIVDNRPHPAYPMTVARETAEPLLKDLLCYHIEDYGYDGISVLVDKKDDKFLVTFADWHGTKIEIADSKSRLKDLAAEFLNNHIAKLINIMKMIRLSTAMYYFAINSESEFVLVDVMLNPTKLCGPGMVRDVFGTTFKTQTVKMVDKYNQDFVDNNRNLIIKPSRYRTILVNGIEVPLYMRN